MILLHLILYHFILISNSKCVLGNCEHFTYETDYYQDIDYFLGNFFVLVAYYVPDCDTQIQDCNMRASGSGFIRYQDNNNTFKFIVASLAKLTEVTMFIFKLNQTFTYPCSSNNVNVTTSFKFIRRENLIFFKTCYDNRLISIFILLNTNQLLSIGPYTGDNTITNNTRQIIKEHTMIEYDQLFFIYDNKHIRGIDYPDHMKWQCYFILPLKKKLKRPLDNIGTGISHYITNSILIIIAIGYLSGVLVRYIHLFYRN